MDLNEALNHVRQISRFIDAFREIERVIESAVVAENLVKEK